MSKETIELNPQLSVVRPKTVLQKLASAKKAIAHTTTKKAGRNSYSEYDYFTPEQVNSLVQQVCEDNDLVTVFNLIRDENSQLVAKLDVICVETGAGIGFTMAMEMPEIKATNASQRMGGSATYAERYLKQTAFGIADNNLDFDSTSSTKKYAAAATKKAPEKIELKEMTQQIKETMLGFIHDGKAAIVEPKLSAYSPSTLVEEVKAAIKAAK